MQSEVRLKTDSFKLYLSIGLFATIIIITLAVLFRFEVGVILLGAGGLTVLVGGVGIYYRVKTLRRNDELTRIGVECERQRLRKVTAEADRAVFLSMIFTFSRNERALVLPGADVKLIEAVVGGDSRTEEQRLLLDAPHVDLLPLLDRAERVLVKGASDAGKTTLFQHIASRSGGVVIVDPHYKPGVWPEGARIIGAGRNFGEISAFLEWLAGELDGRYKRRAVGEEGWQEITVIIDEFMTIKDECEDAGKTISMMIRESRKVGFRLFVGSHSELVKPLGLEGAGDVREGLLIVRLYYSQIKQERRQTVDAGEGEMPCHFPPYSGPAGEGPAVVIPDLVIKADPAEAQDAEFVRLVKDEGMSRSAASLQAYGRTYAGNLVERGRRALGEI